MSTTGARSDVGRRAEAGPGGPVAIRMRGLTRVFGPREAPVHALDGVDLDLPAGRLTAVVGPSGSGKSTLLHCAAALDAPTSGSVRLGDIELTGLSEHRRTVLRRERVGVVFQDYNLIPSLTVAQNVTLPARLAGRPVDGDGLGDLLAQVGLADRLDDLPSQLSGGQQQRVAIVRALVCEPAVVVADEPTGALDLRTAGEILDVLRTLVEDRGQTVVMVTHDPRAAARADQVVTMADGRITGVLHDPDADTVALALLHGADGAGR